MKDGWYRMRHNTGVMVRFVYNNMAENNSVMHFMREGYLFEEVLILNGDELQKMLEEYAITVLERLQKEGLVHVSSE